MSVSEKQSVRTEFFEYLFGVDDGYVCIATIARPYQRDTFAEKYFKWPTQEKEMHKYIEGVSLNSNVYFCVNLLSIPKRKKENCIPQNLLWADLDSCRPDYLEVPPQCVIESSTRRYQAIWRIESKLDPLIAEEYSRRIAYAYADKGADKSGHDLTQLLRVPGTYNYKYELDTVPTVTLVSKFDKLLSLDVFHSLPEIDSIPVDVWMGVSMPELQFLPDAIAVAYSYQDRLKPTAFARYYGEEPESDWSKPLWRLINTCFEVGMSRDEVFVIARTAKCNKYQRDGRPESHLWREILKAEMKHVEMQKIISDAEHHLAMPQLLTEDEHRHVSHTIIHQYREWAESATDAVPEFHELSCAILLSSLMSAGLRIPLDWGEMHTNLWGLVLGDSTLTRKTTSMQMAMEFLYELDHDLVVASDGSAEGLLTAISLRPKMVSVFFRDEITGFLDSIHKKDYLSAMPEIMTNLYDVPKFYPRRLRKETISVVEPIFIFFGGGIKDRTFGLIDENYFLSGFLPRFLVVTGNTDLSRVRRTGPPKMVNQDARTVLRARFSEMYQTYSCTDMQIAVGDGEMISMNREVKAYLTDDAWEKAGTVEDLLIEAANKCSERQKALPSFQRMYFSMLKLATLLCASRRDPNDDFTLTVEKRDIIDACYFIQRWGSHYVELVRNSGHSKDEVLIQAVYRSIERKPGIMRSDLMNVHKLNAKQMNEVQETLEQRMMVHLDAKGRGAKFYPIGR